MATETDIAAEDRPKVYLETSFMFYLTGRETTRRLSLRAATWRISTMRDNEIIAGIREARRAFAAEHGNNLRAISEAAMKFALDCGFKPAEVPANPNFHYPCVSAAAV